MTPEEIQEIVEFLRGRFDEDEWIAKGAASDHGAIWEARETLPEHGSDSTDDHIARHDPARVLREVESKRLRVALAVDMLSRNQPEVGTGDKRSRLVNEGIRVGSQVVAEAVLKSEAHVYADHADFKPRWAV